MGRSIRPGSQHRSRAIHGRRRLAPLHRRHARHQILAARSDQRRPTSSTLEVAWRFKTDILGPRPEYKLEGTPLAINGILYATGGTRRSVVALDGKTGELIWAHSLREGKRAAVSPRQLSGRGLSYWTDGNGDERILYVTTGYRLVALNAHNGAPIAVFGKDGIVDLKDGVVFGTGQQIDLETGEIGLHATPAIVKDVVIVGSSFREGATVRTHNNTKGLVRAFDVRSGKLLWTFNTIPRPASSATTRWEKDSWAVNGNTGVWTQITVDEELGLVYLPVETPTSDFYGGHRPGNNLFAESLVCVDLKTGQRKWHFQLVHHPLWNYDMSSAPILADITVNGKAIKAVAVPGKQAFLYVFDRVTGQPVWPIEERPVPQSDVPGEKTIADAAVPHQAAGLRAQLPEGPGRPDRFHAGAARAGGRRTSSATRSAPWMYNPPVLGNVNGLLGAHQHGQRRRRHQLAGHRPTIRRRTPSTRKRTTSASPSGSLVAPPAEFSDIRYVSGVAGRPFRECSGPATVARPIRRARRRRPQRSARRPLPAPAAPAASAPAVGGGAGGLDRPRPADSEAAVRHDLGDQPRSRRHRLAGARTATRRTTSAIIRRCKGMTIPKTGQAGTGGIGLMVTKTLVVMGDPQMTTTPEHPRGAMLRAYDKTTGKEVGAVWMAAPQSGSPMTYLVDGKQYIVVAISGGNYSGEYVAFTLPGPLKQTDYRRNREDRKDRREENSYCSSRKDFAFSGCTAVPSDRRPRQHAERDDEHRPSSGLSYRRFFHIGPSHAPGGR